MFDICNLVVRYFSKIGFLRQISSDQADDLFHRTLLPRMIRVAEKRLSAQRSIDVLMIHVFFAVIVSDRFPSVRRYRCQPADDGF